MNYILRHFDTPLLNFGLAEVQLVGVVCDLQRRKRTTSVKGVPERMPCPGSGKL